MFNEIVSGVRHGERPGTLVFAQVDHLSGEILGEALEQLCMLGAANVQLLPTLTKKGRPGHVLLVDSPGDKLAAIEQCLVADLGVTGWHRLATQHVYVRTESVTRTVTIHTSTHTLHVQIQGKRFADDDCTVVPEHSSCVALRQRLAQECGVRVPLRELARLVGEALNSDDEAYIDLRSGRRWQEPGTE